MCRVSTKKLNGRTYTYNLQLAEKFRGRYVHLGSRQTVDINTGKPPMVCRQVLYCTPTDKWIRVTTKRSSDEYNVDWEYTGTEITHQKAIAWLILNRQMRMVNTHCQPSIHVSDDGHQDGTWARFKGRLAIHELDGTFYMEYSSPDPNTLPMVMRTTAELAQGVLDTGDIPKWLTVWFDSLYYKLVQIKL